MLDVTIARALHILAIVHWIGGVFMVTAMILPAVARMEEPKKRITLFEKVEARFATQAKISVTLAGVTGFYMTHRLHAWDRFLDPGYWWMHAMVLVWTVFTVVLFVAEPLFLHAWFLRKAKRSPDGAIALVQRFHWVLLSVSLVAIGAAALGAHGMLF